MDSKANEKPNNSFLLCNANGVNGRFRGTLKVALSEMQRNNEPLPLAICITESKLKEGGCGPPD